MMNETTIRTWGGRDVRVGQSEGDSSIYASVDWPYGEGKNRSTALFAKPGAIRFAKALLDAVGQPFLMPGDGITIRTTTEAGHADRPATLSDVDRILAAIREGEGSGADAERLAVEMRAHQATADALARHRVEIDSLRLSIAKRDRDEQALRDRMAEWERRACDATAELDKVRAERNDAEVRRLQAATERDAARAERDEIGHRLRAENDRLIDRLTAFEREAQASGEAHTNAG